MSEGPIFQIGSQQASGDIFNTAGNLNISQNSSSEDMVKVIDAIKYKTNELDIGNKDKEKIGEHLENAKKELGKKIPDKGSIAESFRQTNDILKEAKTTGESLKEIGTLVAKVAVWLGTTAAKLGWIF